MAITIELNIFNFSEAGKLINVIIQKYNSEIEQK